MENKLEIGDLVCRVNGEPFRPDIPFDTVDATSYSHILLKRTGLVLQRNRVRLAVKPWSLLSTSEKKILKDHHKEDGEIEMMLPDNRWITTKDCLWLDRYPYRIKEENNESV